MPDAMPPEYWEGIEQFNHQQFYTCHDTLEAIWMEALEAEKPFYQGILQISVALYHLNNGNWRGAAILLGEGSNRLRRYTPDYGGIDVERLLAQSQTLLIALQQRGPDQITELVQEIQDGRLPLPQIERISEEAGSL